MQIGIVIDTSRECAVQILLSTCSSEEPSIWFRDVYHDSPYLVGSPERPHHDPFVFMARHFEQLHQVSSVGFSVIRLDRTSPESVIRNLVSIKSMAPHLRWKIGLGWAPGLSSDDEVKSIYEKEVLKLQRLVNGLDDCNAISVGVIDSEVYNHLKKDRNIFFLTSDPNLSSLRKHRILSEEGARVVLDLSIMKREKQTPSASAGTSIQRNSGQQAMSRLIGAWRSLGVVEAIMTASGFKVWEEANGRQVQVGS